MGTNYYARVNICECCGRYEEVHLGKSSAGWTFGFHATGDLRSFKDWKEFLVKEECMIFDEYGEMVGLGDFLEMVEKKRGEKNNHALRYWHKDGSFLDTEGNSMTPGEFS